MIAGMQRIEVVCLLECVSDTVAFLHEEGVVHVEEVPLAAEGAEGALHRVHLSGDEKAEIETLDQLQHMLREIVPFLTRRPGREKAEAAMAEAERTPRQTWGKTVRAWSREVRSMTRRRENVRGNIGLMQSLVQTISPIEPLLSERNIVLGKGARIVVIEGEVGQAGPNLEKRLRRTAGESCEFIHQIMHRNTLVGIVLYPKERDEAVARMLYDEGIAPLELPDKEMRELPLREVLKRLGRNIEEYRRDLAEIEEVVAGFSEKNGHAILAMLAAASNRLARLHVLELLARTEMAVVFNGWIPSGQLAAFETALAERLPDQAYAGKLPTDKIDRKRIPILLENPKPLEPFEVLLSLLKPPAYGTIDASALVGVSFIIFYGFILGDVAYGLAVIALSFWMRHTWGHNTMVRGASAVATYAGMSAIIFGIAFGEFCGDLGTQMFGMQPLWFHRGHDTITLLKAGLVIGAVHISLSLVLGIIGKFQRREMHHALEQLGMALGLFAVGLVVFGIITPLPLTPMAVLAGVFGTACVVLLIYSSGAMAAIHLFEVISLVSNVLSYSRLMALGVASVALADVANRLGAMASTALIGVPIALSIHLLNLCIGMFSPTLHSMRLNYVEFLPKFYSPDGRKYEPFRKEILL